MPSKLSLVPTPDRPFKHITSSIGEVLQLGGVKMRILEDGTNTDNRLATALSTIPPHTWATPPHYHAMHDETFFVTRGKLLFWAPGEPKVEVLAGELVVVPTHAPHTFENASDEEAEVLSTFTPAHYVHYFRTMVEGDDDVPVFERARRAQAEWATMPAVEKKG